MIKPLALFLPLTLLACAVPPESPELVVHGMLRSVMHEGDTGAKIKLSELVPGPHSYALGALSDLRGEVTIVDDSIWVSYPDEAAGHPRTVISEQSDEAACLLVSCKVEAWRRIEINEQYAGQKRIAAMIERVATSHGLKSPFPFLIKGAFEDLDWHVIDGTKLPAGPSSHQAHMEAAQRGLEDNVEATVLGFFSLQHKGVFTHHDSNLHMHVIMKPKPVTAHIDNLRVMPGCYLFLPDR